MCYRSKKVDHGGIISLICVIGCMVVGILNSAVVVNYQVETDIPEVSQICVRLSELKESEKRQKPWHVSHVKCYLSGITCHISNGVCHM